MPRTDMNNPNRPNRLVHFLLKRLRRESKSITIQKAIDVGVLSGETKMIDKHRAVVYRPGILAASADEAAILRRLKSAIRVVSHQAVRYELDNDEIMATFDDDLPGAVPKGQILGVPVPTGQVSRYDVHRLINLVAESAEPPRASDVATLLMLADAIGQFPPGLADVVEVLSRPRPVVAITGEVRGFENALLSLVKRGIVTAGPITKTNGFVDWRTKEPQFDYVRRARNKIICFAGKDYHDTGLIDRVGYAAQSPYPIVAIAESEQKLPLDLVEAAQLHLISGPLTTRIIELTIETVLGASPVLAMNEADCIRLGLADLDLAIRPGISATRAVEILAELAAEEKSARSVPQTKSRDNYSFGKVTRTSSNRDSVRSTGSEIVQPFKIDDANDGKTVPMVETLSGYGDAKKWAIDLKEDLALWRSGDVEWSDMSTKLLLSGAPGTGKTFFAKALCNTLQIPLIATSVATWLEGGFLNDVLRRMSDTFGEAVAYGPSILFVDEIDGIGTRGSNRGRYSDYWNTLVNRALELFDGVSKSDGIILVAATNLPALIDPALLRSGRLERHIPISPPDVDDLCGILRHQIGNDLTRIIPSGLESLKARQNIHPQFRDGTAGLEL